MWAFSKAPTLTSRFSPSSIRRMAEEVLRAEAAKRLEAHIAKALLRVGVELRTCRVWGLGLRAL